jgi:hypothetical protein
MVDFKLRLPLAPKTDGHFFFQTSTKALFAKFLIENWSKNRHFAVKQTREPASKKAGEHEQAMHGVRRLRAMCLWTFPVLIFHISPVFFDPKN